MNCILSWIPSELIHISFGGKCCKLIHKCELRKSDVKFHTDNWPGRGGSSMVYLSFISSCSHCVNNMAPSYLCNLLEKVEDAHGRDTRASSRNDLVVRRSHIAVGDKAFQHRGPLCWNSIPSDVRDSATIVAFKKCLFWLVYVWTWENLTRIS